ncbi:M6 family metalloprotease domain-containing protein [Endomicrobium proavitum]|uniref:Peptidase M6-like domain-containing protein n=1 Tax=Endomicrobium proavitum TaxID=1408281 RepID=A0A0G3WJE5_9BACT|nr:M6 family metalloprotease domain-containing protein [Endomicrobium proavitum]AKL97972.1 exported protein of unknown function [Endomicrobium proavitum]
MRKIILTAVLSFLFCGEIFAVSASPALFDALQPDGEKVSLRVQGDEFYHWTEDKDGYTVIQDTPTKEWRYARRGVNGKLEKTQYKVSGRVNPASLSFNKHVKAEGFQNIANSRRALMLSDDKNVYKESLKKSAATKANLLKSSPQLSGSPTVFKHLVLLVAFSDKPFRLSNPEQVFLDFFDKANYTDYGALGSVNDFYNASSYGQLQVESVVSPVITLSSTSGYYAGASGTLYARQMVQQALVLLDASHTFDFAQFDQDGDGRIDFITVVHAGGGMEAGVSDAIWSHKWNISPFFTTWDGKRISSYNTIPELRGSNESAAQISRIGVAAHELGHAMLHLPDLYDTTYASYGVGNYDIMGGGSWNGPGSDGSSPALFSAWTKYFSGFIDPVEISSSSYFSLPAAATDQTAFYKFSGPQFRFNEYYLIENRQGIGFDQYLPGSSRGVLIWHVDERKLNNGDNNDPSHYLLDLQEADGSNGLAVNLSKGRDSFYYRNNNNPQFTNTSNPSSIGWDGYPADIAISQISATGSTMTFKASRKITISSVTQNVAVKTVPVNFSITGNDFPSSATVKLINGANQIYASNVSVLSSSAISASVTFASSAASGLYGLQIIDNVSGDSETKTGVMTVYAYPQVTSLSANYVLLSGTATETIYIDVNGSNFVNSYTSFYIKNDNNGSVLNSTASFANSNQINLNFQAYMANIGTWTVYMSPYPGVSAAPALNFYIGMSSAGQPIDPLYDVEIPFPVEFSNGAVGTGSALIRSATFNPGVVVSVSQNKNLPAENLNGIKLKHTNLGVDFSASGHQPAKTILLKIPYTVADIAGLDEDSLVIARYQNGSWLPVVSSVVDKQNKYVSAQLDHLSIFALMSFAHTTNLDNVIGYPNPLKPHKGQAWSQATFTNLPDGAQITIYTSSGEKITALQLAGAIAIWDGKNSNGEFVASGVYMALIKDLSGNKKVIKIAVER